MKNIKTHAWRLLGVVALLIMVAGCADGELATPLSADITPAAPMIIKFAADPSQVKSGESTSIMWEVAGADEVSITAVSSTGDPVSFNVETEELSGSAPVTLTSTTDFVLTAKKTADSFVTDESEDDTADVEKGGQIQFGPEIEDEEQQVQPSAAVSEVTQTITVAVIDATEFTADIEADDDKVDACTQQTVIRWTVTPSENVSIVVVADTGEVFDTTDQCEGSMADILGQEAADPIPAVGCAVVNPCEDTTYTVTATDASGDTVIDSVPVAVSGDVTAEIFAAKDASSEAKGGILTVESFEKPVIVSWTATPEGAKVTVTATPSAICDLPSNAEGQTTGSVSCQISGETTFEIVATLGSETADDVVLVTAGGGAAGLVVADQWAFESERIDLEMKLTSSSNAISVSKLLVNGTMIDSGLLASLKAGSAIKVPDVVAMPPHVKIQLMDSSGNEMYSTEKVQVIELNVKDLGQMSIDGTKIPEARISSVAFDKTSGAFYSGVEMDYSAIDKEFDEFKGIGRIYKNHAPIDFNFIDPIKSVGNLDWNDAFFYDMEHYPVAVGVRAEHSDEIYAGVTGAIMRSEDGGKNWEQIMVSRRRGTDGFSTGNKTHPTCGRAEAGGQKQHNNRQPKFDGDFVSLNQVCDVIALSNGRVIAAMDFGVMVEKDIDDENKNVWVGIPSNGVDPIELGALTFGHVVNDLLEVDGKIFAATDTQVFVSSAEQGGIGWSQFGEAIGPVYALDYDARNQEIYAATEDGLYASPIASADWYGAGLYEPVISVAVDPAPHVDPDTLLSKITVIAGTPTGAKITRDRGMSWYSLPLAGGEQAVESIAIVAKSVGNNLKYGVAFGSTMGELFQEVTVGAQTLTGAAPVEVEFYSPTTPGEETPEETPEEVPEEAPEETPEEAPEE